MQTRKLIVNLILELINPFLSNISVDYVVS